MPTLDELRTAHPEIRSDFTIDQHWERYSAAEHAVWRTLFHRQAENPALSRAEALRQAELALIDGAGATDPATKKITFSYAHPIFWAPFSLVGDGG